MSRNLLFPWKLDMVQKGSPVGVRTRIGWTVTCRLACSFLLNEKDVIEQMPESERVHSNQGCGRKHRNAYGTCSWCRLGYQLRFFCLRSGEERQRTHFGRF